ncbi:MAG: hypothetical protein ACJ8GO_18470 [Ramlibacter sp.]
MAYAKANPDKTNYGSSSASFQLVTELFKQKTGAPMQVIPYNTQFRTNRSRSSCRMRLAVLPTSTRASSRSAWATSWARPSWWKTSRAPARSSAPTRWPSRRRTATRCC